MDRSTEAVRLRKDLLNYVRRLSRLERRTAAEQFAIIVEEYMRRRLEEDLEIVGKALTARRKEDEK